MKQGNSCRRSLTSKERDEASKRRHLVDVVRFMLGTGVRIAEALVVEWADLDFDAGTVHVRGTNSEAADCELELPGWLLDALEARYKERGVTKSGLVFLSQRDTLRDSVNVMHQLRDVLDRSGSSGSRATRSAALLPPDSTRLVCRSSEPLTS